MTKITCQMIAGILFLVLASVPGTAGDLMDNAVLDINKVRGRVCYELLFGLEKVTDEWKIIGSKDALGTLEKYVKNARKAGVRGAVGAVPPCTELILVHEIGALRDEIDELRRTLDEMTAVLETVGK